MFYSKLISQNFTTVQSAANTTYLPPLEWAPAFFKTTTTPTIPLP